MTEYFGRIYPGKRVRTLFGERDVDECGRIRQTLAGAWGHVVQHNLGSEWVVSFPNGAHVVLLEAELLKPKNYELADPATLEQLALALQFGQGDCELTILDSQLVEFTQEIAGNPEQILDLIAENRRLKEEHADMLGVIHKAWMRWDRADQEDNPLLGGDLERICSSVRNCNVEAPANA
jgi:hypothetical protein